MLDTWHKLRLGRSVAPELARDDHTRGTYCNPSNSLRKNLLAALYPSGSGRGFLALRHPGLRRATGNEPAR